MNSQDNNADIPPIRQRIGLTSLPLTSEFLTEKRFEDQRGAAHLILNGRQVQRVSFLTLKPGTGYRGGHFHRIKNEGLYVVEGEAEVEMACTQNGERLTMRLEPGHRLDLPPLIAHRILALTPLAMVEYADRPYDAADDLPFAF